MVSFKVLNILYLSVHIVCTSCFTTGIYEFFIYLNQICNMSRPTFVKFGLNKFKEMTSVCNIHLYFLLILSIIGLFKLILFIQLCILSHMFIHGNSLKYFQNDPRRHNNATWNDNNYRYDNGMITFVLNIE